MRLAELNRLQPDEASLEFLRCCGSARWAGAMAAERPFADIDSVETTADRMFDTLGPADWLEAFVAHPRIGETERAARAGRAGRAGREGIVADWSAQEQAAARGSDDTVRDRLAKAQRDYEARFGYIFIICATGKSADDMLSALERRVMHGPDEELRVAAEEQRKITHLRIRKLLEPAA